MVSVLGRLAGSEGSEFEKKKKKKSNEKGSCCRGKGKLGGKGEKEW